jgi:hypothetical protein
MADARVASLALAGFAPASAADLIVSAQDGKFVRVEGRATFPESPLYAVREGKLVDTGERIKLAAGPVSIRSMPR